MMMDKIKKLKRQRFWLDTIVTVILLIIFGLTFAFLPTRPPPKPVVTIPTTITPPKGFNPPVPKKKQMMGDVDFGHLLYIIWDKESNCGMSELYDPDTVGPAGERGEYQITPIFIREVERLCGRTIDPMNNASCRAGIYVWMEYWAKRVGAKTEEEMYELYRYGPTGYRERRKK